MHGAATIGLLTVILASADGPASPDPPLPLVTTANAKELRAHAQMLLRALAAYPRSFPADAFKDLRRLLRPEADDGFPERLQKLLDPQALVCVTINPESRVKAMRGPADARLTLDRSRFVLIKVINEAGVTHALHVASPQFRTSKLTAGRWLQGALLTTPPLRPTLTGHPVEYAILELTPCEPGRREALLTFDVGQGTQDLGFRAEVPVLFDVRADR